MAWIDPGKEFVDGGGGQLFANLKAAFAPTEIRTGLDNLGRTVSGATPATVFEQTLMPAVGELKEAQDLYRVGEGGFNRLHSAVYDWHTKAETGGFNAAGMEAAEARSRAAQAVITDAVNNEREPTDAEGKEARDASTDLAKKIRERTAADAALTAELARIATWIVTVGESVGISPEEWITPGTPGTPGGAPDCAVNHLRPAHGGPGGPAASPRIAPSGAAPGPAPARSPEAQARVADLLKELQQQQQGQPQPQQQPQPAVAAGGPAGGAPAAAQPKPAAKKSDDAIPEWLRGTAADPSPAGPAGIAAAAAAAAPAAAGGAPIAPPAPKPQVGGTSFSGATTSTNVSGGQTSAPRVTLSAAEPVQDTRAAGQRTGAAPMGGGGVPVAPGYGGGGQQGGAGKPQEKILLHKAMTEQERDMHGRIARDDEAVRGGTLCRGDHEDSADPQKRGPRKR